LTGRAVPPQAKFPWLIKFLDCHGQLSVQVHPDDRTAQQLLRDETGKTEAWIVLEAEPTARIQAGLKPGTTPSDLVRHLDAGTVAECLHSFAPRPGDCVFLPAGTVHAAGGGVMLAEVQQSSDATFRLFDWNRLGPGGTPRPLHRQEALASIHWPSGPVAPATPRALADLPAGVHGETLVRCDYFHIDRYRLSGDLALPHPGQMSVWMLIGARAELRAGDGSYHREFRLGETVLIPASAGTLTWSPARDTEATLLAVTEP
jgi:mannose-6-phosphate isomerase